MNCFPSFSSRRSFALLRHLALLCALLSASWGQESWDAELPYFRVEGATGALDLLPLKSVDVSIEIVGTLAEVELVQTYANVGGEAIEAVYVFPGSTCSAVSALTMRVGDRVVEAEIQEKRQARRTYEVAKAEGKTASLLEQERPNVFQMNLANILPGDVVEVTLRYTEWLQREKGEYAFELPLVVGPRYTETEVSWVENPRLVGEAGEGVKYGIAVRIRSAVAIERAVCDSHEAEVSFEDGQTVGLSLEGDADSVGNRDFRMRYRISGDAVKSGVWVSESGGEKYFMASLEPPLGVGRKRLPREYFFVVDVSGSMRGFPLDTAKAMMEALVARLDDTDRFNVLLFSGESEVFSPAPVSATVENLLAAVEFLYGTRGSGGTRLLPALKTVYDMPGEAGISRNIVVLTDGYVTVEDRVFDLIRSRLGEANVFACGIGSAPNRFLIEGMAKVGQGEPFFVAKPEESERVANRFSEYVSEPILTDLKVIFDGVEVSEVEPVALPDLLAERPVVVFGKYVGDLTGEIVLSGLLGDSEYRAAKRMSEAVNLADSRSLEYVWARERIRRISDYNGLWPSEERREEITRLGLKHSLLTHYTSFVAVDKVVRNREGGDGLAKIAQPLPSPQGMQQGIGGSSVPVTPEPEMWALMGLVLVAVSWILVRRGC
ncbi:VIT domain-containing protein [Pelagicoccus sp. SDUM812005]|uniref:VIT domain-containing protein n=1 Tax=Pelagicoccus sp. SDUM812005 TaxID=3041257 RepID=UPI00280EF6E5|nr:VIT domain-containing protein [Pelagicoccus sp. SDUM812005]MDQ8181458.1 VIT domain-containing protein [Pelagicoccus sp. SDUM812005]